MTGDGPTNGCLQLLAWEGWRRRKSHGRTRLRSVTSGAAEARWIRTPPPMIPPARQNSSKGTTPAALGQRLKGQNAMLISEDYRQLAERCLRLASECSEPLVADALRALATDYLARAGSPAGLGRGSSARPDRGPGMVRFGEAVLRYHPRGRCGRTSATCSGPSGRNAERENRELYAVIRQYNWMV